VIDMIVGYARTSTIEQVADLEAQLKELQSIGCDKIYQEQISSIAERSQLKAAMDFVREGDVLVVAKLDRLARSVADLLTIVQSLEKKNVFLRILNLGIDTNTPTGKLMLTMLGAIGQFEREIMLERQREGIAKAKAEGKFKGRKPLDQGIVEEVLRLCETRITRKEVAERLEIGEATVYRVLKDAKPENSNILINSKL
jgi:DNA invertase Pin-like site-specific DNA recombinase